MECWYCTKTLESSPFRWNEKVCCGFCFQSLNEIVEKLEDKELRGQIEEVVSQWLV